MFSRPKILFLVSLLFVALLNPKFNPYLLFKFLIFYHSSIYIYIYIYIYACNFLFPQWIKSFVSIKIKTNMGKGSWKVSQDEKGA